MILERQECSQDKKSGPSHYIVLLRGILYSQVTLDLKVRFSLKTKPQNTDLMVRQWR
jgi:hypothetical protein